MSENEKTTDMVNTTDCLEAVNAFKAARNFFFFVVLICLLLLQGTFWLQELGYIEKAVCTEGEKDVPVTEEADISENVSETETIEAHAEIVTGDASIEPTEPAEPAESIDTGAPAPAGDKETKSRIKFNFNSRQAATLISTCNFILIISATLYCLTLLMSIKISLVGRLGGINHISRAFLLSLFGLVLLLPWQKYFGGVVAGAIYTPQELLSCAAPTAEDSVMSQIFYYLRFVILWVVTFMLFFFAQVRSARWSCATLRRLGMIH
ncbi:MAG: hypothetical protein ACYTFK_05160 [Planctomycetota bacterium]|jgi:hypothetical protein